MKLFYARRKGKILQAYNAVFHFDKFGYAEIPPHHLEAAKKLVRGMPGAAIVNDQKVEEPEVLDSGEGAFKGLDDPKHVAKKVAEVPVKSPTIPPAQKRIVRAVDSQPSPDPLAKTAIEPEVKEAKVEEPKKEEKEEFLAPKEEEEEPKKAPPKKKAPTKKPSKPSK